MKKIIAFGASNSKNSINKQLASYTANQVEGASVEVLDLNDYPLPMYGIDLEQESGIPENAQVFLNKIKAADGIVISFAEHNGAYASVFKNLFDWMSRIDGKLWSEVPMFLMATSPGGRGGQTVLDIAAGRFPYMGGNIVAKFSLPSFGDNFSESGIAEDELAATFKSQLKSFDAAVNG
ncbi:NAD(P)H-dependent oxidoreductase [Gilvibacter sp.]|uniref:NADPH-dependent FMN reductase n=1 Tax=Gilvibacter sp. TaxID=2729997 RepID=UPI0025B93382|nr:NAD(P)H-dependent oxidoreductase [Gilvibacter sp.]NQX78650.1 NAD(P)H-dependent oxidoreductase [Gilvibacter sp.]